jgi:hypothetical protein
MTAFALSDSQPEATGCSKQFWLTGEPPEPSEKPGGSRHLRHLHGSALAPVSRPQIDGDISAKLTPAQFVVPITAT